MARQMVTRILSSKLPVKWVCADEVYGNDSAFRSLLEQQGVGFVVAVGCDKRLFWNGRYDRIDAHRNTFPAESWQTLSCGTGAKGERLYDWSYTPYGIVSERGFQSGLLIHRSLSDPTDHAYFDHACARRHIVSQIGADRRLALGDRRVLSASQGSDRFGSV